MRLATTLTLLTLFCFSSAFAQKPVEPSALEIGEDPVFVDASRADQLQGALPTTSQFFLNAEAGTGSAEDIARSYLRSHSNSLGLSAGSLELVNVRESLAGTTVRFWQTVDGVPVWGPHTVVNLDRDKRVQAVLAPQVSISKVNTTPSLAAGAAEAAVLSHLGAENVQFLERELMVLPGADDSKLVWQIRVEAEVESLLGTWEGLVDAQTGELIRVADRTLYHAWSDEGDDDDDDEAKGASPRPLIPYAVSMVDGTATTFDPDPLTMAGATYGDPGFSDNGDADSPEMTAILADVALPDITLDGSTYRLEGPYAHIVDHEAPNDGTFEQDSLSWTFTRGDNEFEAPLVYYHLDHYMRYINEDLGIDVMPTVYTTGVQYDPHGLNGADNSHYSPASQRVAFGEGCVDDSEDADVVIHELGHGIHDWITGGGLSQVDGLSEGTGDYFAASYTRSLGLLDPSDASYNWVFKWDGHNECWGGRVTDYTTSSDPDYPGGLTGSIHTDGQMWSSTNMRIWDEIGREKTDAAVIEGLGMTNSSTSQEEAAAAALQAAVNMGYTASELQAMWTWYDARGYNVELPVGVVGTKEFSVLEAAPGDTVAVTVTLNNQDADPHTGIVVTDSLPGGLTFNGNIVASAGTAGETDGTVTWNLDLAGSASETLSFDVVIDEDTLGTIENTATVNVPDQDPFDVTASIFVDTQPDITYEATPNMAIPDDGYPGSCAVSEIEVTESFSFDELRLGIVTDHTYRGDLVFILESPDATSAALIDRVGTGTFGVGADNFDGLVMDGGEAGVFSEDVDHDTAAPFYEVRGAPEQGEPGTETLGALSDFAGTTTQGTWTLSACDGAGADTGSLLQWGLLFYGTSIADEASPKEIVQGLTVPTPNPVRGIASLKIAVDHAQDVTVDVFDVRGRRVQTLYDGTLAAGMSETLELDASALPAGVYVIRATGEDFAKTRRVTVVR